MYLFLVFFNITNIYAFYCFRYYITAYDSKIMPLEVIYRGIYLKNYVLLLYLH